MGGNLDGEGKCRSLEGVREGKPCWEHIAWKKSILNKSKTEKAGILQEIYNYFHLDELIKKRIMILNTN